MFGFRRSGWRWVCALGGQQVPLHPSEQARREPRYGNDNNNKSATGFLSRYGWSMCATGGGSCTPQAEGVAVGTKCMVFSANTKGWQVNERKCVRR